MESGYDRPEEDDDVEMLTRTFEYLVQGNEKDLSCVGLIKELQKLKDQSIGVECIEGVIKELSEMNLQSIDIEKFKDVCSKIPHIQGHRLEWVKSLNLNTRFANKLRVGVLWDGLLGLKEMKETDVVAVCNEFAKEIIETTIKEWENLKNSKCLRSDQWEQAASQMSKFRDESGASSGNFGNMSVFHEGLEQYLGAADPYILKGILYEHIHEEDSKTGFMPSNYGIYTTPKLEFARLLGNIANFEEEFSSNREAASCNCKKIEGPASYEIRVIQEDLNSLKEEFEMVRETRKSIFPGEKGDKVLERKAEYKFELNESDDHAAFLKIMDKFKKSVEEYAQKEIFVPDEGCLRGLNVEQRQDSNKHSLIVTLQFKPDMLESKAETIMKINELVEKTFNPTCNQAMIRSYKMQQDESENTFVYSEISNDHHASHSVRQCRKTYTLKDLTQIEMVQKAGLRLEEAVVAYQYTGPLFQKWNSLLRKIPFPKNGFKDNRYATTIHTLVSAVVKTSKKTKIPASRKVYRGLSGMLLDERWLVGDERSVKGGVEYGFLSTTQNKRVAMEYSGVRKNRGVVFEMEVGAIDCGAELESISQYPGEKELLFGPLTHLEAVDTRIEFLQGKPVVVVRIKVNCNLKAPTIEDILYKRKRLFAEILDSLHNEVRFDVKLLQGAVTGDNKNTKEAAEEARSLLIENNEPLLKKDQSWYNDENNFLSGLQEALKNKTDVLAESVSGDDKTLDNVNIVKACLLIGERGKRDLISVLVKMKVRLSLCDELEGESMLFKACEYGQVEFVKGVFNFFDHNAEILRNLLPRITSLVYFMLMALLYIIFGIINNSYVAALEAGSVSSNTQTLQPNCTGWSPDTLRTLKVVNYIWIALGAVLIFMSAFQLWRRQYLVEFMMAQREIALCDPVGKAVSNKNGVTPLHVSVRNGDENMVKALIGPARLNRALRIFANLDSTFLGFLAEYFMTQAKNSHGTKTDADLRWAQLKVVRLMLNKHDFDGLKPIDYCKSDTKIRKILLEAAGNHDDSVRAGSRSIESNIVSSLVSSELSPA